MMTRTTKAVALVEKEGGNLEALEGMELPTIGIVDQFDGIVRKEFKRP